MNNVQKNFGNATFRRRSAALAGVLALAVSTSLLTGCASMLGSVTEPLPIASTPPDAQILIIDEAGRTTYRGRTPDTVALPKSNGHYWGGKKYTVAISKQGYLTQRVTVDTHPNALYLGGNLIFGGVIGWFIVDPTSSKMYGLSSEGIDVTLQKAADEAQSGAVMPGATLSERPIEGNLNHEGGRPGERDTARSTPLPADAAPMPDKSANARADRQPTPVAAAAAIAPPPGPESPTAPPREPAPAPIAPPTEAKPPRPYWPAPPPLPAEPLSALPAALPLA